MQLGQISHGGASSGLASALSGERVNLAEIIVLHDTKTREDSHVALT